jgi:hypothetical protein
MKTVTLLQLRTEIQDQGDYANSSVFTPPILNRWINRAIAEVRDLVISTDEHFYTVLDTSLTTAAGVETVALPSNFYVFKSLGLLDGSRSQRIRRGRLHDWHRFVGGTGKPCFYLIQGAALRLMPTPDAAYSLRLFYDPVHVDLAADGDTFDSVNYYDELVVQKVLLRCDQREERSTADRRATIAELEKRVRKMAADQDRGEPQYMADLGDERDAEFY